MANELPYFRFTVQAWQNGKISIESYELQGLFISICGYYWINDCSVTLAMLRKKFSNATFLLEQLLELEIIKHETRHDKVEIEFLNLQYDLLSEKRKRRQLAGSKGGNARAMLKQKHSYKDNNKDKDNKCVFDLSFVNPKHLNTFSKYIEFRKEIKKGFKSSKSVELAYKNLVALSGDKPELSEMIVNKSISNGWQGLFPLNESDLKDTKAHPYTDQQWSEAAKRMRVDGSHPAWFDKQYLPLLRKEL